MRNRGRAGARLLLLAIVACAAAALIWPGPALATAAGRPFVLGLPWPLFWSVAWLVVVFVAVGVYHLRHGEDPA